MRHFVQSSDVSSDFNLTSFSLWFSLSEAERQSRSTCWYTDLCNQFLGSDCGMALDGSYLHDHAPQLDATDASMDEVAVDVST